MKLYKNVILLLIAVVFGLGSVSAEIASPRKSTQHVPELKSEEGAIIQKQKGTDEDIDDISIAKGKKVLVDRLNALVFVDEVLEVQSMMVDVEGGVHVNKMKLPEGLEDEFVDLMREFIGQPVTYKLLNKIASKTVRFYHKHEHFIVDVVVPSGQDITNGVVQLAVIRGIMGDIVLERDGRDYFSDERILSSFTIEKGQELDGKIMLEDLRWMNNNPFRVVNLVLKEGDAFAETDVVLRVHDRFPLRGYAGLDNTGTPTPDEMRYYVGVNWGDVLGWDHSANYQFTTSQDVHWLQGHSLSYVAPLPWRHTAKFFFSYSKVDPDEVGLVDTKSETWYAAIHYIIPLPDWDDLRQEILVGYEFKQTNSDILFADIITIGSIRDISQFVLGYSGSFPDRFGSNAYAVTLYLSPGSMTNHNKDLNFTSSRALSESSYSYVELTFQKLVNLWFDFTYILSFAGQLTTENLLSSEQFGLGGYATVRGYREYEVNVDNGYLFRNEIRTPAIEVFTRFFTSISDKWDVTDGVQLLAFVDYGGGSRKYKVSADGAAGSTTLVSAGTGFRYSFSTNFTARLDVGWKLKDTKVGGVAESPRDYRIHFGLTGSI